MSETPPDPPAIENLIEASKFLILPMAAAAAGLLMRWADDVRHGRGLTWRRVVFETPSLIGFGIMGGGIGAWLGAPDPTIWAISALFGHLGTQGVIDLLLAWTGRKRSKRGDKK